MKRWKLLLGMVSAAAATEAGIATYFFNRTMLRQNATTERTMKMAGTNWDTYMPMLEECKDWMMQQEMADVWTQSNDGIKLHGTFFPNRKSKKIVLCFHGYTGQGMSDFIGLSNYYLKKGYQMILTDARAHGKSEGTYIGFGCLDRNDVMSWIQYAIEQHGKDCEIWLHGISMGAATVLMSGSLELPDCVKGIISDCAFTSAWDVFEHVLKSMYHLPAFPILHLSDIMAKYRAGYSLKECNAAEEVKRARLPILFIHGNADSFVPCSMCYEIYRNCIAPKDLLIVDGAGHAEAFYRSREEYEMKLTEFLNKKEV